MNYVLPKFPAGVRTTFKRLSKAVTDSEVPRLKEELKNCIEAIEIESRNNPNVNLEMARALAERCEYLLDRFPEFDNKQRALAMGAIRYFVIDEDSMSDTAFASGFDDDVGVMNYVLQELGIEDQFIELP